MTDNWFVFALGIILLIVGVYTFIRSWLPSLRKPDKHKGYGGPPPPQHFNCRSSLSEEPDYVEYQAVPDSRTDIITRENIYRRTSRIQGRVIEILPGGWFRVKIPYTQKPVQVAVLWICYQKTGDDLKVRDTVEILEYRDTIGKIYFLTGRLVGQAA